MDARAFALFLDLDGTLLDIAPAPSAVVVPEGLVADLAAVAERLDGALAILSGRPIAELDRLLAPLRLPAAGIHGAELRLAAEGPVLRRPAPAGLARARALLAAAALPAGVEVEDKGLALALHWRRAAEPPAALLARLEALAGEAGSGLEAMPGKAVLELRGAGLDKGRAVAELRDRPPFAGRVPIGVGDDRTDLDAFRAVEAAGGLAVPVGPRAPGGRAPLLAGPAAVRAWLARVARGGPLPPAEDESG